MKRLSLAVAILAIMMWGVTEVPTATAPTSVAPSPPLASVAPPASPSPSPPPPPPPTKPAPKPATSIVSLIHARWPGDANWAVEIARCESRLKPKVVSPTNDWGLMQINWPTWGPTVHEMGYQQRDLLNPVVNLKVAWHVYKKQGRSAWACNQKI